MCAPLPLTCVLVYRAEHFVLFLRRFVEHLKKRISTATVVSQHCASFLEDIAQGVAVDGHTLRFCSDRLTSLMKTLEIHNTDDYLPIQLVADFGTLLGTCASCSAPYVLPPHGFVHSIATVNCMPLLHTNCTSATTCVRLHDE